MMPPPEMRGIEILCVQQPLFLSPQNPYNDELPPNWLFPEKIDYPLS
jgi:hypothetical protein